MHEIVLCSYQKVYSIYFKNWTLSRCDLEFVMGSFLMGAKHKFYFNRLGSVSSLCLLFLETEIFPTHTQDRMINFTHIYLQYFSFRFVNVLSVWSSFRTSLRRFIFSSLSVDPIRLQWRPFEAFPPKIFYFAQRFDGRFRYVLQSKTWPQLVKLLDPQSECCTFRELARENTDYSVVCCELLSWWAQNDTFHPKSEHISD